MEKTVNVNVRKNTQRLTIIGVLTAIIFVQSFVPFLGLIPIPPFNPTIIHITVIIGAVMLGPLEGCLLGLIWGLLCIFRAYFLPTTPIDPIVFTNPIISVLPRVLIGLFSWFTFHLISKFDNKKIVSAAVAGVVGSITNTVLVLSFIYIFYKVPYANFYKMDVSALLPALLSVVLINGSGEAIAAGILVPLITKPLFLTLNKR